MMKTLVSAVAAAALIGLYPAAAQEQSSPSQEESSWWGVDLNSLSGAAEALGLWGSGAGSDGGAPGQGAQSGDWTNSALQALGGIDWSKAAESVGISGLGGGASGADGAEAAPAGYLQQMVQGLLSASPEQRAAFLNGVTAELPKLADEVTTWWNGLPSIEKEQYLAQINQMIAYLAGMVGLGGAAPSGQ